MDPNETVCFCNDVTRGMIKDAIAAGPKPWKMYRKQQEPAPHAADALMISRRSLTSWQNNSFLTVPPWNCH